MGSESRRESGVSLTVSPDRMTVHACWESAGLTTGAVWEGIEAAVATLGLKLPDDPTELRGKVEAAVASADESPEVLLLSGTPVTPPVDERVVWTRDFFARGFLTDEKTGRINYRERAASLSVRADEVLAVVTPGEPGVPGTDVFGKSLPVAAPKKAGLRAGRNVKFEADARRFVAVRAGRLRLIENTVTVDETYEVEGSVGLETGNIRFVGHLVVRNEIEDVAVVEAEGGVEVANVIGAAKVTSGGDVMVGRGIAGGGKCRLAAKGTVQAGYISGATVKSDGDVVVLKEILQSDVRSRGVVRVETGRVVGGQVVALGGVVVAEAGSSAGIPTLFVPGEDYTLGDFVAERERESNELSAKCDGLRAKLKPLADLRGRLTAGQKRTVTEVAAEIRRAEARQAEIRQEISEGVERARTSACREVRVLKELHPRVTFHIGKESLTTEAPRRGPVVVRLDESGGIAVLSDTG